jgi:sterol desaturase/sphingolipid hydroxylase (fatty acid hydroxylase superfamily)
MNSIIDAFYALQGWVFETLVLPTLFAIGLMEFAEPGFGATEYVLLGIVQLIVVYATLRPLEAWFPAEQWTDRRSVRTDVLYTVLQRLGIVPIGIFALLAPFVNAADAELRMSGYIPAGPETVLPALAASPFAAFLVYLVILDFADYWRHRLQHRLAFWWALHSLHHSQRQLSFWADDRNHLLDDVIAGLWFTAVAFLIGVPPGQFVAVVMVMRFVESLSHANVRLGFGAVGERLLVSPSFHRTHHAIGVGHEGRYYGCNFATLFPLWDILFRTANFRREPVSTGIADQLEGRDYGEGYVAQQWFGLKRLVAALGGRA